MVGNVVPHSFKPTHCHASCSLNLNSFLCSSGYNHCLYPAHMAITWHLSYMIHFSQLKLLKPLCKIKPTFSVIVLGWCSFIIMSQQSHHPPFKMATMTKSRIIFNWPMNTGSFFLLSVQTDLFFSI
jgi:hypothetical protein